MKLLGFELKNLNKNTKLSTDVVGQEKSLSSITEGRGGFLDFIRESFTGAWQSNIEVRRDSVLSYFAVYSCMTLISSDMGKLRPFVTKKDGLVRKEVAESPFSKILKKPNKYQTWQKFAEQYNLSKLSNGNVYLLKEFDTNGKKVVALHILDPKTTRVLVDSEGEIWYQVSRDPLTNNVDETNTLPANYIIHDTMVSLFHPLMGVSPIYACGLAATQGLSIQNNSTTFFSNMSRPSGMLSAPDKISDATAERLKKHWDENYSGGSIGRLAVLGDGLKYEAMTISAVDSQLLEQLKWTAETVCSCFHVPAYKIGVGALPTNSSAEILNQIYYSDCLQTLIKSMESSITYGLGMEETGLAFELDIDDLIKMDTATHIETLNNSVKGGWLSPNEARQKRNLSPVEGGETPYMQQQNYALSALAERDRNSPLINNTVDKPGANDNMNDEDLEEVDNTETDNENENDKNLVLILEKTMQLFRDEKVLSNG